MSLLNSLKIKVSDFHREKIEKIDNFDYSKVMKKVNDDLGGVTASYINQGIENLKRYYVVALLDPVNRHAVSKPVDPFWHTHVLFTEEYTDFCNEVFGHYIHHTPLDFDDKTMVGHVTALYDYTLQVYDDIFTSVDENWWPNTQDNPGAISKIIICYHVEIKNETIRANALFAKKPELMEGIEA